MSAGAAPGPVIGALCADIHTIAQSLPSETEVREIAASHHMQSIVDQLLNRRGITAAMLAALERESREAAADERVSPAEIIATLERIRERANQRQSGFVSRMHEQLQTAVAAWQEPLHRMLDDTGPRAIYRRQQEALRARRSEASRAAAAVRATKKQKRADGAARGAATRRRRQNGVGADASGAARDMQQARGLLGVF
jgi:hypothetical protein